MVLSTEWSQVEVIDLINDGSGLGFGIVGGRSTGVVIKSILPGGIADKDNRLQSGDHILQIGDVHLRGLGSEQVASVLRQAGNRVRIVVARPIESVDLNYVNSSGNNTTTTATSATAPFVIVSTKILQDPEELARQLVQNGYVEFCQQVNDNYDDDDEEEEEEVEDEEEVNVREDVDNLSDSNCSNVETKPIVRQCQNGLGNCQDDATNCAENYQKQTELNKEKLTNVTHQSTLTNQQDNVNYQDNLDCKEILQSKETLDGSERNENSRVNDEFKCDVRNGCHANNCTETVNELSSTVPDLETRRDTKSEENDRENVERLETLPKQTDNIVTCSSDVSRKQSIANGRVKRQTTLTRQETVVKTIHSNGTDVGNRLKSQLSRDDTKCQQQKCQKHSRIDKVSEICQKSQTVDTNLYRIDSELIVHHHRKSSSRSNPDVKKSDDRLRHYRHHSEDLLSDDIESFLPETERHVVDLTKNEYGLGITIAGYVCEREDLSGIFVKSLNEGSEAYKCGKININDRIVKVDGNSLQEVTNHEAVERLKKTGNCVKLTLERYLRGPKYEQLQEALACQDNLKDLSPPSPSVTTLSWIPIDAETQIEGDGESVTTINEDDLSEAINNVVVVDPETKEIFIEENFEGDLSDNQTTETTIRRKWETLIGSEAEVVVAHLTKLKGLGISLEGTVDVEGGLELRPRHYIRSILPEGPVGQNGQLNSGDELLEVNGQKLLGKSHVDVVKILRELPNAVRLVCARKHDEENRVINTSQDREAFEQRNIVGGSLKNLLPQPLSQEEFQREAEDFEREAKAQDVEEQKVEEVEFEELEAEGVRDKEQFQRNTLLTKSLSDTSINTSSTTATVTATTDDNSLQKPIAKSRSLTNLAMWSEDVDLIDLIKTDRGLGFSILDYQDPLDLSSTLIVIRSLVPNGTAEQDGRIKPGDRLVSVNGKPIKNFTLDQAVQLLKGTLPGNAIRLGIAKPLQVQSHTQQQQQQLSVATTTTTTSKPNNNNNKNGDISHIVDTS